MQEGSMGFFARRRAKQQEDAAREMAESIARAIASQWPDAEATLRNEGVEPGAADISGAILVVRYKARPLSEREQAVSQQLLADGFPETPLALCKALWESEIESMFSPEHQGAHRDIAYAAMGRVLADHGLVS